MVDADFFDKLEEIARVLKNCDNPFGGIQLVLCGDFLQLPPVSKKGQNKKFCFQSPKWDECIQTSYELTEVKRQNDQEFINMLQYIRVGKCPDKIFEKLMATQKQEIEQHGIQATQLCTHKDDVEQINAKKMEELKGESKVFTANDSDSDLIEKMNSNLPVQDRLLLKVGAQVMLTKNLDLMKGLVNGSRGVVIRFQNDSLGLPLIRFSNGLEVAIKKEKFVYKTLMGAATRHQLPLKCAWAISIHKSQGLTLDCCEISLSRVFEHGQAYVALSRAKNLEGLRLLDMNRNCVKAHPAVLKFYINLRRKLRMERFDMRDSERKNDENLSL